MATDLTRIGDTARHDPTLVVPTCITHHRRRPRARLLRPPARRQGARGCTRVVERKLAEGLTEEPDVWESRLSGSERGRSATGVWTRYCGTAAKAGGQRRRRTSSCSSGRLLPTRRQVWQATDTQLNREVALKIPPDAFAGDPDRLARFKREAQILASLNHPNIAAIYGIEEAEGTRALVLELVEDLTLADRISKGPIPLDEALPIAKQIAEALEAAHEAGVIHRDLKPANIKLREDVNRTGNVGGRMT